MDVARYFKWGRKVAAQPADFASALTSTIKNFRKQYRKGERNWSLAHYGMVFGGLLASFAATLTLNFGWQWWSAQEATKCATALTALSTLLGSLGAAGGFQGKWRSNRLSRSQLDCISIDLSDPNKEAATVTAAAAALKEVIAQHDAQIVDADAPTKPVDPAKPIDSNKPVDPTKPVDPNKPVDPTKPFDPNKPVDPAKPVDPNAPVDPNKPVDPS